MTLVAQALDGAERSSSTKETPSTMSSRLSKAAVASWLRSTMLMSPTMASRISRCASVALMNGKETRAERGAGLRMTECGRQSCA